MPRKADPLPVNLSNLVRNRAKWADKKRFIDLLIELDAIRDAATKGEISNFSASMLALQYLSNARSNSNFSADAWQRYLSNRGDETVTIPVAWVQPLLDAWKLYIDPNDPVPFEKAAGLSGEGRSRKASSKVNELLEKYYLASFVLQEKLAALESGGILSDDDAFNIVEGYFEDEPEARRSKSTIRDAWARWGQLFERHLAILSAETPDRLP